MLQRRLADPPEASLGPLGEECERLQRETATLRAKLLRLTAGTVTAEEKRRIAKIYENFHRNGLRAEGVRGIVLIFCR
jgi:hypothetical protein